MDSLAFLLGFVGLGIVAVHVVLRRKPASPATGQPPPEDPVRRDKAVRELQERLENLKRKLDASAAEADADPRRAAKAVRRMMRQG